MSSPPPCLYVVATPIGNLDDISPRCRAILSSVDWIACEDSRVTQKLLHHLALKKPLIALHEHNEMERRSELVAKLKSGQTGALVSDAGTPGIADPGYRLVAACHEKQIKVLPIAGPNALATALSASGLDADRFAFIGFLPRQGEERRLAMQELSSAKHTVIFYESPQRLHATLADLAKHLPPTRLVSIARELTKLHEEIQSRPLGDWLKNLPTARGEFTVIVEGASQTDREQLLRQRYQELQAGTNLDQAAILQVLAVDFKINPKRLRYLFAPPGGKK